MMLVLPNTGCTHYGVSGPEDLGLAARFDPQTLPTRLDPDDPDKKLTRNQVLSQWLLRSDFLCADYMLQLSRSIRDTRLATDFLATVLSGLATILAQPAVTRPLAGSATIALGIGGDIQSDLFLQQAGDVVGTAIQAVRTRARTDLQKKFAAEYADYTLEQGLVDVQRYDRETCNLNVGLNEIRASLNTIGPVVPQASNPIVPLPQPATETGAGRSPESIAAGATPPMATTIIPPNVQNTPQGGFVFTPGRVVNTPAPAGMVTIGTPTPPAAGPGSTMGVGPPPGSRIVSPREPPPPPVPLHPDAFISGALNESERRLLRPLGKYIQSVLCLAPEQQTGDFGPETRDAIQSWRSAITPNPVAGPLSEREIRTLEGVASSCDRTEYKSAYERFAYPTMERIMSLQRSLAGALSNNIPPITVPSFQTSGKLDDPTREAIRAFQRLKGVPESGIMTRQLRDKMAV
jgi:hypothetical protein